VNPRAPVVCALGLAIAALGPSCGDDGAAPPDTPRGAAERACDVLASCDDVAEFELRSECVSELGELFEDNSQDCNACLADITCGGWGAIERGERELWEVCEACAGDRRDEDDPAPPQCVPGTQSTPNSFDDPCPQDTPQCPLAGGYEAISTCRSDGQWDLQCYCVLINRNAPIAGTSAGSGVGIGGAGGSGGSGGPPPVACGTTVCSDPLAAMMLPAIAGLPTACCADAFTSTCGTRFGTGACTVPPPDHPDCSSPGAGVATCCTAQGSCGVLLNGDCLNFLFGPQATCSDAEHDAGL
jgi:hypothetical protein